MVPTGQAASRWPRCKQAEFGRPRREGARAMIRRMLLWWLRQSEMRRAAFASKLGSLLPGPYSRSVTRCTFRSSARDAVLAAPQWMALCSCGCCRMKAMSPVPSTRAQKVSDLCTSSQLRPWRCQYHGASAGIFQVVTTTSLSDFQNRTMSLCGLRATFACRCTRHCREGSVVGFLENVATLSCGWMSFSKRGARVCKCASMLVLSGQRS